MSGFDFTEAETWGGRVVDGPVPGTRCTVEGTTRMLRGRLTLWNPLYRFELG